MENLKDIDDVVLSSANDLVTYVHLYADGHSLKKTKILSLAEIPELLISLFELITDEPIPDDQKPFRTLQERGWTLQGIIDTLEQHLHLPLSHISGQGVAKLDRRQLCDIIQIFDDLIRQLCTPRYQHQDQKSVSDQHAPAQVFTLSKKESSNVPAQINRPLTLEQLNTSPQRDESVASVSKPSSQPAHTQTDMATSPTQTCTPSTEIRSARDNQTTNYTRHLNRKPSTDSIRSHKYSRSSTVSNTSQPKQSSTEGRNVVPNALGQSKSCSSSAVGTEFPRRPLIKSYRYKPSVIGKVSTKCISPVSASGAYLKRKQIEHTSAVITATRCMSPISSKVSLPRKPLVHSLTRKSSRTGSNTSASALVQERTGNAPAYVGPSPLSPGPNKPRMVPIRRISTRSVVERGRSTRSVSSPLEKSSRRVSNRRPSTKSLKAGPKVVKLSKSSVSEETRIKNVRFSQRKPSFTAKTREPLKLKEHPVVMTPKRRRPSVVSSKVRKHSIGSPALDKFRLGTFSPRTVSLASSIKLLQEFDYVIKRLSEIEQEMERHLEALRSLREEKIRLEYVMEHVKRFSERQVRPGTNNQNPVPV